MKMINKILIFLLGAVVLISCEDILETAPEGGTLTQEQKKDAFEANPALLASDVAAMYANMIAFGAILGEDYHNDFGYAAACLMMESNGADMTCANVGYNWFAPNASYADRVYTNTRTLFMWNLFYKQIASANLVISSVDSATTDPTLKAFRGQALAVRAFDYLNLAQTHQFTFIGHEEKLCVPIVTEKTTTEQLVNNPRASVKAVYQLIKNDLDEAITLLEGYKRPDKGYIDQAVAYGLRARANLIMGEYSEAADDAEMALNLSGAGPYSRDEVSVPAFWNANDNTVIWANIITENNDIVTTGIINMPSHLCSFYTDGYVGVGAWKKINKPLYDLISKTDVRKGWWLNENLESPLVADASYDKWFGIASSDGDFGPYTNVKFGADNNDLNTLIPAQDWFLMRAEEMLFIKAEGLAMSGRVGDAKNLLENFVKTNRDSNYKCNASTPETLRDEIWFQRRIELWGEGFYYFDIMRLKKPVTRVENGVTSFPDAWQFNIPSEDPILLWLVPKSEIEANEGISEEDNNRKVDPPVAQ